MADFDTDAPNIPEGSPIYNVVPYLSVAVPKNNKPVNSG